MKPRITLLTLGVDDLERALAFYRDGLGLPSEGIVGAEFEHGAVAFFELEGGLRLALFPRASLARDAGLPQQPASATELTIGHNVASARRWTRRCARPSRPAPPSSSRPRIRSGRLCRLFPGPGRPFVGGGVESAVVRAGVIVAQASGQRSW
ncbi:Uncharacterised protein [Chromobacterium violaceum]|uniref:Glyoxalase/fosfomycin resistance/dioxygenase domain-containing protein n=1 Tax=Chromobacterium violaceum TaxID=536 RepID=A0A447TA88_CHRVL|nr:Uncharacterised protein [Chromobacterium violaceum]